MQTIDVTAHSPADPSTVYRLLTVGASWPTWSPIGSFDLERPGSGSVEDESTGAQTLGAIRLFHTAWVHSREEVVALVPDRRLSYELRSGMALNGYHADVDLTPDPAGGTGIRWHSTFTAKVPGTGWLYRWMLGRFIQRCADGLARHAASGQ